MENGIGSIKTNPQGILSFSSDCTTFFCKESIFLSESAYESKDIVSDLLFLDDSTILISSNN